METRSNEIRFRGLVIEIEHMEVKVGDKGWHPYQIIRHPGGVAVLPLHDDGTVTLIRQLRPAVAEFLLELPAGRLSPGEEPEACGRRELLEETGLSALQFLPLGFIHPTPGICDERIYLYLATGLTQGESEQEPYEDIQTLRLPLSEALEMAANGAITDSKTVAALFRAERRLP
jgi:ADP-ribose pyrophosphatase